MITQDDLFTLTWAVSLIYFILQALNAPISQRDGQKPSWAEQVTEFKSNQLRNLSTFISALTLFWQHQGVFLTHCLLLYVFMWTMKGVVVGGEPFFDLIGWERVNGQVCLQGSFKAQRALQCALLSYIIVPGTSGKHLGSVGEHARVCGYFVDMFKVIVLDF